MQSANRILTNLRNGSKSFGAWQMLPGSNHSRAIASCKGLDWILVDTEHGNIDVEGIDGAMHEAVAAIAACGVSPLVRIAANEGWMVKRALDTGAHGIIVPLMYDADDARGLVRSAKFPPAGSRGFGSPFPLTSFGMESATEYLQQANESILTIVQIETKEALTNVEEIARVDGVDVLFVGPFDLGNNIGRPILDGAIHEELKTAIARILSTARDCGKKAGIYCTSGDQANMYAEMGFHMLSISADMIAIPAHFGASLDQALGVANDKSKMSGPYGR